MWHRLGRAPHRTGASLCEVAAARRGFAGGKGAMRQSHQTRPVLPLLCVLDFKPGGRCAVPRGPGLRVRSTHGWGGRLRGGAMPHILRSTCEAHIQHGKPCSCVYMLMFCLFHLQESTKPDGWWAASISLGSKQRMALAMMAFLSVLASVKVY